MSFENEHNDNTSSSHEKCLNYLREKGWQQIGQFQKITLNILLPPMKVSPDTGDLFRKTSETKPGLNYLAGGGIRPGPATSPYIYVSHKTERQGLNLVVQDTLVPVWRYE